MYILTHTHTHTRTPGSNASVEGLFDELHCVRRGLACVEHHIVVNHIHLFERECVGV